MRLQIVMVLFVVTVGCGRNGSEKSQVSTNHQTEPSDNPPQRSDKSHSPPRKPYLDLGASTKELQLPKPVDVPPFQVIKDVDSIAYNLVFSPDGERLYIGTEKGIVVYDKGEFKNPKQWLIDKVEFKHNRMLLSADGSTAAMLDKKNAIHVWDTQKGTVRYSHRDHKEAIEAFVLSPDGKTAVSAESGTTSYFAWSTIDGNPKWKKPTRERIGQFMHFLPNEDTVVLLDEWSDHMIFVRSGTGEQLRQLSLRGNPNLMACTKDGSRILVTSSLEFAGPNSMALLDGADLSTRWVMPNTGGISTSDITFHPNGKIFAFIPTLKWGVETAPLTLCDVESGAAKVVLDVSNRAHRLAFSSDGELLACIDGLVIKVWKVESLLDNSNSK